MNRVNETMLTSPNLNYTSRDFTSIYNELINSIPLLTKEWRADNENDPGVVLLKAISMIGDMLSYNQDKQALEAFPRTVIQRANAQQIFRLIGYKMHWWRSAIVEASFTNANTYPVNIARYNQFYTSDGNISYVNVNEITIPAGTYGSNAYKTELVQGIPITPRLISSIKPNDYNVDWHSCYDYNVDSLSIVGNKIYFKKNENIDETSIVLIDNDETPFALNEWRMVNNINVSESMDKVFEFDVSEDGIPHIVLPSYWNTKYVITKFKIFYIRSNGKDGEIEENTLTRISSRNCYTLQNNVNIEEALTQVIMYNSSSTYGYMPETCTEARLAAEKYQNTIDTLVILKDFEKATRRIDSVANVLATDIQTDPNRSEMLSNQINLWIIRKNDYNNAGENYIYSLSQNTETNDEIFKENIIGELKSYKLMPYEININLENKIDWFDWTVAGQIFLRKPINVEQNYDLLVRINNNLKNRFNTETLDFNEAVNYMDVIECIMKTDKNIWHVDLDTSAIEYSRVKRNLKGNKTGFSIKNKYMIFDSENKYTGYYMNSFGCSDIYINKIRPYVENNDSLKYIIDENNNIIDENKDGIADSKLITKFTDEHNEYEYLATTDSNDVTKTDIVVTENSVTYGGSGYGKNIGNKIIREDGIETVLGIDLGRPNEPREYEVYNKHIIDWTGYNPIDTGRVIDTSETPYKIKKYNEIGELIDTGYTIQYDSRMYANDGSDANKYFIDGYQQIDSLCDMTTKYSIDEIKNMENTEKEILVSENKLRRVYNIWDRLYNEWTRECVDKITGEIFKLRGDYWYSTKRSYDEESGEILDTYGSIQYDANSMLIREPACREDITCEYIQFFDVDEYNKNNPDKAKDNVFEFYLGQDANGNQILNSIGKPIEAYPIKPFSLYIYVNVDEDIIADNGSGKLTSTPGLLDGWGTIDYDTGLVSFKVNSEIKSLKILYIVNKLTYSHYINFDTSKLFVRPEYIKNDLRK